MAVHTLNPSTWVSGPLVFKHLTPHQQMRTDAEDGDFDVVFQLQRKEMLQQLLALLSAAVFSKAQLSVGCNQDKQPQVPPKER